MYYAVEMKPADNRREQDEDVFAKAVEKELQNNKTLLSDNDNPYDINIEEQEALLGIGDNKDERPFDDEVTMFDDGVNYVYTSPTVEGKKEKKVNEELCNGLVDKSSECSALDEDSFFEALTDINVDYENDPINLATRAKLISLVKNGDISANEEVRNLIFDWEITENDKGNSTEQDAVTASAEELFDSLRHGTSAPDDHCISLFAGIHNDPSARERIISANFPLVAYFAKRLGYIGKGTEYADLLSAGRIGLIEAVDHFDITKNFKFSTYAFYWIRKEMLKCFDENSIIKIPQRLQKDYLKYKKAVEDLENKGIGNPSEDEITAESGLSEDMVHDFFIGNYSVFSLNATTGGDDETELADRVADSSSYEGFNSVETDMIEEDFKKDKHAAFNNFHYDWAKQINHNTANIPVDENESHRRFYERETVFKEKTIFELARISSADYPPKLSYLESISGRINRSFRFKLAEIIDNNKELLIDRTNESDKEKWELGSFDETEVYYHKLRDLIQYRLSENGIFTSDSSNAIDSWNYTTSLDAWIEKGAAPDYRARKGIYLICFALGLDAGQVLELFAKGYHEPAFAFRSTENGSGSGVIDGVEECVYYFCFKRGLPYKDAYNAIRQIREDIPDKTEEYSATSDLIAEIDNCRSIDNLKTIIRTHYNYIVSDRESGRAAVLDLMKKYSSEKIVANKILKMLYVDDNLIKSYNAVEEGSKLLKKIENNTFYRQLIKGSILERKAISNIISGKAVSDKDLRTLFVLLSFYNYYSNCEKAKGLPDNNEEIRKRYEEFLIQIETDLLKYGFLLLYPFNPFDYLIFYCTSYEFCNVQSIVSPISLFKKWVAKIARPDEILK